MRQKQSWHRDVETWRTENQAHKAETKWGEHENETFTGDAGTQRRAETGRRDGRQTQRLNSGWGRTKITANERNTKTWTNNNQRISVLCVYFCICKYACLHSLLCQTTQKIQFSLKVILQLCVNLLGWVFFRKLPLLEFGLTQVTVNCSADMLS